MNEKWIAVVTRAEARTFSRKYLKRIHMRGLLSRFLGALPNFHEDKRISENLMISFLSLSPRRWAG